MKAAIPASGVTVDGGLTALKLGDASFGAFARLMILTVWSVGAAKPDFSEVLPWKRRLNCNIPNARLWAHESSLLSVISTTSGISIAISISITVTMTMTIGIIIIAIITMIMIGSADCCSFSLLVFSLLQWEARQAKKLRLSDAAT